MTRPLNQAEFESLLVEDPRTVFMSPTRLPNGLPRPIDRSCLYLRLSQADRLRLLAGEDVLAAHRKDMMARAGAFGVTIAPEDVYAEVASGRNFGGREKWMVLLPKLQSGYYDCIFAHDEDRLTRGKLKEQGDLVDIIERNEILVVTRDDVLDIAHDEGDEEKAEIKMLVARIEWGRNRRRSRSSRMRRALDGRWPGGKYPYGITSAEGIVRLDERHLPALTDLWRKAADGWSATRLEGYMQEKYPDLCSPRAVRWWEHTIRSILRDPVYFGFLPFRGKLHRLKNFKGLLDHGFTMNDFYGVQERMAVRTRRRERSNSPYLVDLYCKEDGVRMYGSTFFEKKSQKVYRYYVHAGNKAKDSNPRVNRNPGFPSFSASEVEARVLERLRELRDDPEFLGALLAEINREAREGFHSAEAELRKAQKVLRSLERDLEDVGLQLGRKLSEGLRSNYEARYEALEQQVKDVRMQIRDLQGRVARGNLTLEDVAATRERLAHLDEIWEQGSNAEKKALIKDVFKRIEIDRNGNLYITGAFRLPPKGAKALPPVAADPEQMAPGTVPFAIAAEAPEKRPIHRTRVVLDVLPGYRGPKVLKFGCLVALQEHAEQGPGYYVAWKRFGRPNPRRGPGQGIAPITAECFRQLRAWGVPVRIF